MLALMTAVVFCVGTANGAGSQQPAVTADNDNSFPDPSEILQGRVFRTPLERDVFFLRKVRQSYPQLWPALLNANIVAKDYVQSPDKLLRFIQELGNACAGTDDLAAVTNLAAVTSDPIFYANAEVYHPEILQAAAAAMLETGPRGRQALAGSFNEGHYRADQVSLELFADVIGKASVSDSNIVTALEATAFHLTATNGGSYPQCTKEVTRNLLRLPAGPAAVARHLNRNEIFKDPGRFQTVIESIATAHASTLMTNLVQLHKQAAAKLDTLRSPSPYRDDLQALQVQITTALQQWGVDK